MTGPRNGATGRRPGGRRVELWAVATLAGMVALELGIAAAVHRTDEELQAALAAGAPRERAAAVHVLCNRDDPVGVGPADLLASGEPLLRELAFTTTVTRLRGHAAQAEYLRGLPGTTPEARRCAFHLSHAFEGGAPRMKTFEVRQYLRDIRR